MQTIQKVYEKYTLKTAVFLTSVLVAFVVIIGIISQQPVPAWWFAFVPILLRLLK